MSTPPATRVRRYGDEAIATPANMVTIARLILAVPTLLLIVDQGSNWLTVSLWFVLTTTDGLDGWLARRDGTTRSGAFLDPLADKFLVLGGFFALGINGTPQVDHAAIDLEIDLIEGASSCEAWVDACASPRRSSV